jgi:NAD(P)H-hydrate epimerase
MATGGAGDVLAGILGGLLGQESALKDQAPLVHRYEAFNRTVAVGIYIHSLAGRLAADTIGVRAMSARSLIEVLPKAFNEFNEDIDKMYQDQK